MMRSLCQSLPESPRVLATAGTTPVMRTGGDVARPNVKSSANQCRGSSGDDSRSRISNRLNPDGTMTPTKRNWVSMCTVARSARTPSTKIARSV